MASGPKPGLAHLYSAFVNPNLLDQPRAKFIFNDFPCLIYIRSFDVTFASVFLPVFLFYFCFLTATIHQ